MKFIAVIFYFAGVVLQAQSISINEVRKMYFEGWEGECGAKELADYLEKAATDTIPVLMAYKAAATTTLANCRINPLGKLSVFNEGKNDLEKAVDLAPEDLEVRFIRYTVQTNIPGILNYDDTETDKQFIIERLTLQKNSIDQYLKNQIVEYLLKHGDLSGAEQKEINHLKAKEFNG